MTAVSPLQILRGGYRRIRAPENWLQGTYAQDIHWRIVALHGPEACRFCAIAALWAAAGPGRDVADALAFVLPSIAPAPSLSRWNDEDGRVHGDVLTALEAAIARATRGRPL